MIKNPVNTDRSDLASVLPLDVPYMVFIDPCNACNFRCDFCAPQSSEDADSVKHMLMDYDLFCKVVDDISTFGNPLRILRLYAMGEPLLHPLFADMVTYAKRKGISRFIETVTNGSRLTPDLNTELSKCGIDRIRISIEGVDDEVYRNVCRTDISLGSIAENIADLYSKTRGDEGKKKVEIYVKTVDIAVKTNEQEQIFYNMFGDIADRVFIENIGPIWPDFDELDDRYEYSNNKMMGGKIKPVKVCPQPLYGMVINPDGDVTPCCADWKRGNVFGNAETESVADIWGNAKMKAFWKKMLSGKRYELEACRGCQYPAYVANDNIDDKASDILARLE